MLTIQKILFTAMLAVVTSKIDEELPCQPREVVMRTQDLLEKKDTSYEGYDPIVTNVTRCSGHNSRGTRSHRCVAIKTSLKNMTLIHYFTKRKIIEQVLLHEKCAMKCVCETTGCGKSLKHTMVCEKGFSWNDDVCACRSTSCFNTEPKVDPEEGDKKIPLSMFVVALVVEFFIVIIVFCLAVDICKCRKHSKGVIYRTAKYVRSSVSSNAGDNSTKSSTKQRNGTGSVSFLHDVNTDQTKLVVEPHAL